MHKCPNLWPWQKVVIICATVFMADVYLIMGGRAWAWASWSCLNSGCLLQGPEGLDPAQSGNSWAELGPASPWSTCPAFHTYSDVLYVPQGCVWVSRERHRFPAYWDTPTGYPGIHLGKWVCLPSVHLGKQGNLLPILS